MNDNPDIGGLLAVWVRIPADLRAAFEEWYDEEHLPERRSFPGFVSAERFKPIDGSENNAALYELTSPDVFRTPEYEQLRTKPGSDLGNQVRAGWQDHERVLYRQLASAYPQDVRPLQSPVVVCVRTYPTAGDANSPRTWFDNELTHSRLKTNGVLAHQVFASIEGDSHVLDVWGMESTEPLASEAWLISEMSPDVAEPARVVQQAYMLP